MRGSGLPLSVSVLQTQLYSVWVLMEVLRWLFQVFRRSLALWMLLAFSSVTGHLSGLGI